MTSGTGSGLVLRNKEGTQIVLARFPSSGSTLSAFGLTPSIIKTIAIPNDIQDWPTSALNGCTNLEKITTFGMPAKEATIVLSLDHGLRNLKNLTFLCLPSTLQKTTDDGFASDDGSGNIFPRSLRSVCFQECTLMQTIGDYALQGAPYLSSICFSACGSLKRMGYRAFNFSFITSLDLSKSPFIQSIGDECFFLCQKLRFLNLSGCSSLQTIGDHAFRKCFDLAYLNFSDCSSLKSIGVSAFYECTNLIFVDLSPCVSLQTISDHAFRYCSKLQTVILPAAVETVGLRAFLGDTVLENIFWMGPEGKATIGIEAFNLCPNLKPHVYNYTP